MTACLGAPKRNQDSSEYLALWSHSSCLGRFLWAVTLQGMVPSLLSQGDLGSELRRVSVSFPLRIWIGVSVWRLWDLEQDIQQP